MVDSVYNVHVNTISNNLAMIENHYLNEIANFDKLSSSNLEIGFSNMMSPKQNMSIGLLENTQDKLTEYEHKLQNFFKGESDLIDIVTSSQESTNQLKLILDIRNKFIESFEKIMNMSI
ncbi:MAG: flagellar hook-basal body complex protein FliE [Rickettsia sp.]|nr:flagellar hook-basal body complex protein FliE [Rickettsia sp.]